VSAHARAVFVASLAIALLASSCARHAGHERSSTSERRDATTRTDDGAGNDGGGNTGDAGDAGDAVGEVEAGDAGGATQRAPLAGYPKLLELRDGADKLGFVSVPLGAREPRPIMIAIHGGSEKPERACAAWRGITEAYAFVVCPRGFGGRESALGWRTTSDTKARVARAVDATRKVFGAWALQTSTTVLTGFSMGGSQVALLARDAPQTYRRIVVGDSAHDPRPALTFSRAWAGGGGERAIFLCTTSGCEPSLRAAARNVATEKARARLNVAATQVHGLSEGAVQSMRRDWPWLVEGAPGWEGYVAPPSASLPGKTESFDPN
jgi:dienelactone hydrolase